MLQSFYNEMSFRIRSHLPSFRQNYKESGGESIQQNVFSHAVAARLDVDTMRQNLFYHWMLSAFSISGVEEVIDVGAKDFVYAPALAATFKSDMSLQITALELDPFKFYFDLYRRGDVARYYAEVASENGIAVEYKAADWLTWTPSLEAPSRRIITCFFPFLFEDLHIQFGLRRAHFNPQKFYEKFFAVADRVLLFHQGEEELKLSQKILSNFGAIRVSEPKKFLRNPYVVRKFPVYGILCERTFDRL